MGRSSAIVVHEDRQDRLPGLLLAVASCLRYTQADVIVSGATPVDLRKAGLTSSKISFAETADANLGWNVKPTAMLEALERGFDQVAWLDADALLARPLEISKRFDPAYFWVTTEPDIPRTRLSPSHLTGWQVDQKRRPVVALNSAFVVASSSHLSVLKRWQQMLEHPDYCAAQLLPFEERPRYFRGDQDALTALIHSLDRRELDVALIPSGREIAHCFGVGGYSSKARLGGIRHRPVAIHAQGFPKPWEPVPDNAPPSAHFHHWLNPYSCAARSYPRILLQDTQLLPSGHASKLAGQISSYLPTLPEVPLALALECREMVRSWHQALRPKSPNQE